MQGFQNILLVVDGLVEDQDALTQALSQARNNRASLSVLVLPPTLPPPFAEKQGSFERSLIERVEANIAAAAQRVRLDAASLTISYTIARGERAATLVVRDVLRHGHDLVIKQAAPVAGHKGFAAADFELLRKCPAPVWLCRPITDSHGAMQVAVAVDPHFFDAASRQLAMNLLHLGRRLADECNGKLMVISAWDYPHERYLSKNAFFSLSTEQIAAEVAAVREQHEERMASLIADANIGAQVEVETLRGAADDVVPERVESAGVDILLMGTIARTGVAGLLVGNTAENVLRRIGCSLVALKPATFVSPIKL